MLPIIVSHLPPKNGIELRQDLSDRYNKILSYTRDLIGKNFPRDTYKLINSGEIQPLDITDSSKQILYIPIIGNDGVIDFEDKFAKEVDSINNNVGLIGVILLTQKPKEKQRETLATSLEKLCKEASARFGLVEFIGPEDLIPKFRPELLKYS